MVNDNNNDNTGIDSEAAETALSDVPIHQDGGVGASLPARDEVLVNTNPGSSGKGGRKNLYLAILLGITVIAVVIGAGVAAKKAKGTTGINRSQPRKSTIEETTAYLVANGVSEKSNLATNTTAQYKAAKWLSEQDGMNLKVPDVSLDDPEGYSYLSRYVLALNYFALDGENWNFQFSWLEPVSICQWAGILQVGMKFFQAGTVCDLENGMVESLYLGTYSVMACSRSFPIVELLTNALFFSKNRHQ